MSDTIRNWTPYQDARARLAYDRAVKAGEPDPLQFVAQLYAESRFKPIAKSHAGAYGEAQFMPATAARFGVKPNDPDSAQYGALKYRKYIREYNAKRGLKGEDYVLAGYNAGEGVAAKALTGYKETREYVRRIHAYTPQIAALLGKPPMTNQTSSPVPTGAPNQSPAAQTAEQTLMPFIDSGGTSYARSRGVSFGKLFGGEAAQPDSISADYDSTDIMGSMFRALNESVKRSLLGV